MLFEKVNKEHILKGIKDFEEKGLPREFGPSSTYDVVFQDKKYPPKAIMAYANLHAEGRKIERYFKGGLGTDCFNAFERNEFIIIKKDEKLKIFRETSNENNEFFLDVEIGTDEWKEIIENESIVDDIAKDILIKFYLEEKYKSTCKHIGKKYNTSPQSVNAIVTNLGKKIQKYLNRFVILDENDKKTYWITLMNGKLLKNGLFEWTLKENLSLALEELWVSEYNKFKKLLEYFVSHLEYIQPNTSNTNGYNSYIKPLIENGSFKKTGQGYKGDAIQNQISTFEYYLGKQICLNIQPHFGKNYTSKKCYLNWYGTGINITANWYNGSVKSLSQVHYVYWEDNPTHNDLEANKSLEQLGLFKEIETTKELKQFFNVFYSELLAYNAYLKNNKTNAMDDIISLLKHKKQIVLQGPPGTGKTRLAKLISKKITKISKIEENDKSSKLKTSDFNDNVTDKTYSKIIQFHPSYTYEDFVRGISVVNNEEGKLEYKTKNRILGEFAQKALKNYNDFYKESATYSNEVLLDKYFDFFLEFINDKIEENQGFYKLTKSVGIIILDEDAFRYKSEAQGWNQNGNRMLFKDIKQAFLDSNLDRQDLKHNENLSGLAKHHASYFIRVLNLFQQFLKEKNLNFENKEVDKAPLNNYVLIIDEINRANLSSVLGELIYALEYRGEAVESMYEIDGDRKITLPPNLFIIGTMNTADRSVGQIDYAIRRRFAFVDVLPKVLTETDLNDGRKYTEPKLFFNEDVFLKVEELFKKGKENSEYLSEEFNAKDVQLGHSYFIYAEDNFSYNLEYEIKPILKEYVADGILKVSALKIIENL
jgi:MoxR-like ATPase